MGEKKEKMLLGSKEKAAQKKSGYLHGAVGIKPEGGSIFSREGGGKEEESQARTKYKHGKRGSQRPYTQKKNRRKKVKYFGRRGEKGLKGAPKLWNLVPGSKREGKPSN